MTRQIWDRSESPFKKPPLVSDEWRRIAFVALAIAGFSLFCAAMVGRRLNPTAYHAVRYCFALLVFGRLAMVIARAWRVSMGSGRLTSAIQKVYAVPRRFGVATLLLMTLGFAILSAVLKWAQVSAVMTIITLGFVGLVGVLQLVFDRAPRHASMMGGSLFFPISGIIVGMMNPQQVTRFFPSDYLFGMACLSLFGSLIGYVTGTVVASLFLIMDAAQAIFTGRGGTG